MEKKQEDSSVLSRGLFGESSDGSPLSRKKFSHAYGKRRRSIRKVIDKKSLDIDTIVIANTEEFERKRRLIKRQTRLRELLGEDGLNVLVINDEVCLEYNFEGLCPVVTVHPFFTKVMKVHQYEGVKFMWDACFESLAMIEAGHPGGGCILAHCPGLGKTLQVLALLHTVLTHPRVGMQRVLVCCPLSTVLTWVDEIHKWIGPVTNKLKVFELSKRKKNYERACQLEDWYKGGGILIIGYELFCNLSALDPVLDGICPTIVNKIRLALLDPGPDIIVCDEGHLLKDDSSVLAVAMNRVTTKRRIVLTGTQIQNNPKEYYCMVNFIKPYLLGSYSEYSYRFEIPIMNGQHRDSREEDIKLMKTRTQVLNKLLEGCLQRQEASVLYPYLPEKHEYTYFIPLTKCQSDLCKHYLTHYTKFGEQRTMRDFHILQKIWTHPQVLHNFHMKSWKDNIRKCKVKKIVDNLANGDLTATEKIKPAQTEAWWLQYLEGGKLLDSLESSNKLLAVFRILDDCLVRGDKVLLFSTSLFTMDTLEYFLGRTKNWSLGREYYRLDGSVPAEVRQKRCRDFNADSNQITKLFLISTPAGSLGLNMTAANHVIILDTSWNPAHDIQSIFRVYRLGQKKACYIYRLVALGTMEQTIYERAVTKQAVVDEQQIVRHLNKDELTELYKIGSSTNSSSQQSTMAPAVCIISDDDEHFLVSDEDSVYLTNEPFPLGSEKSPTQKKFSQNNEVVSDTPSISTPRTPPVTRISLENKANTPNNEATIINPDVYLDYHHIDHINEQVPIKDTTVTNTTVGPHTICLDSDEEDPVRHETAKGTVTNPATNIKITQLPVSVTTMASNVVPLQSPSTLNTPVSGTPEVPNFAPDNRIEILLDELQQIEERKKTSDSDDLVMISDDSTSCAEFKTDTSRKNEKGTKIKLLSPKPVKKKIQKMAQYPPAEDKKKSSTSSSPPKLQTSIPEGVPVELIGSSTNSSSQQSTMAPAVCIISDDDEHFLVSDEDSVYLINEPFPLGSEKSPTQKNFSQNNEVVSDTPSISTPRTPPVTRISLENKANTPNNEATIINPDVYLDYHHIDHINEQVPIKDTTVTNTTVGPHTICLDSDEEDPVRHETAKGTVTNPATNIKITQLPVSVTTMASNVVPLQSPSTLNTPVSGTPEVPNFAPDNRSEILLDELQQIEERKKTSDSDDLVMISDDSTSCAEFKTDTSRKNEKGTKIKLLSPKPVKKKIQKMAQYPPAEDKKKSSTSSSPPKLQTSIPEGVPVELIGSSTNSSSQQSTMAPAVCIISDDDEHFLVSDEDSVYLINEPSPLGSEKSPTQKKFSQNNEVVSDTPSISTPRTPPVTRISLENKANTPNNEATIINPDVYLDYHHIDHINEQVPIKDTTVTNTTVGPHTICLDSDEEDPVRHDG
ncbi:unnamed protein product [Parnassius apollo]|uniref:(apollo) hypothetical protein n=1 Tax=Parnassius apollo TaxID=110799 RepID=A0A8S3WVG8_PARAO|nr:unnamed protein product [Parnassius apollo]